MKNYLITTAIATLIASTSYLILPVGAGELSENTSKQVEIDQAAPVVSRKEIFIAAPASIVWQLHTDFASWPEWQPDMQYMRAPTIVAPGEKFHWRTEGLEEIASTIQEVKLERSIAWGGSAQGITAVHVWIIEPAPGGVTLRTEESWNGQGLKEQAAMLQPLLDASLDRWLAAIKQEGEAVYQ